MKGASEFICDNDANDETKSTKEKQKTIVFIGMYVYNYRNKLIYKIQFIKIVVMDGHTYRQTETTYNKLIIVYSPSHLPMRTNINTYTYPMKKNTVFISKYKFALF